MSNILTILQVIVGALLGALILMQQKGAGVGGVFGGGGGEVYGVKRGAERVMFIATIVLSSIFLALGFAQVLVSA